MKLQILCEIDLMDALPDPVPAAVQDYLKTASQAGFIESHLNGGWKVATPPGDRKLRSHVESIANLLDGSWLELTVLDLVQRSPLFTDAHWSVEPLRKPGEEDNRSFGETDVVCLGLPRGNLHVISCKTHLQKPLEHLEALHERSQNLGGRYACAVLVVLFASENQCAELRRWGRLLNVEILIGEEVIQRFGATSTHS